MAIDKISVQFDRKLKEQRDQIDTQRNEIISLRKANVSHLNAQPQWTRVVNELEQIKLALTDVFGLLRKPESAAPAELLKKDIVSPIDNKPKDTKLHPSLKAIDNQRPNIRTSSHSTPQVRLRQLDVPGTGGGKFCSTQELRLMYVVASTISLLDNSSSNPK
ncbi:hypothetical protein PSTT_05253 [Puccinia striiformis]|uniref:Uncharacterized protein n=1 Tax=Puccinia striiformis TaxID=27350 RepID=A0A2S4VPL5_9BASI|nr:hypothetical protein PSTT_05253 [Puccinia striiformis]